MGSAIRSSRHGGDYLGFGYRWKHLCIQPSCDKAKKQQGCSEHSALLSTVIQRQQAPSGAPFSLVEQGVTSIPVNKAGLEGRLSCITAQVGPAMIWPVLARTPHKMPCMGQEDSMCQEPGFWSSLHRVWAHSLYAAGFEPTCAPTCCHATNHRK